MPKAKSKRKRTSKKAAAPSRAAANVTAPDKSAERFKRDLLIRGEAAYPDEEGKLPSEATHEIVKDKKDEDGLPQVKRRLFKLF